MKRILELLPLRIGEQAYTIVNYKGAKKIKCGVVSQMYFGENMELVVSVKNLGRGLYGKKVFKTYCEALEELQGKQPENQEQSNHYTERFNKVV